ncbi:MAG: DUF1461 domain-containing protein [Candidatus Limnocylindrales bacterium]
MRRLAAVVTGLATAMAILGAALLLLMAPPYLHAGLDASGSAAFLGTTTAETHRLSDETVAELFVGPGTFAEQWRASCPGGSDSSCIAIGQPLYDQAEVRHMQDVRTVLGGFLGVVATAVVVLLAGLARARRADWWWRAVAVGAGALAVGTVAVGALFAVAFDPMFTLFHEIFFPGGDWSFDPSTSHLVQLYPIPFWELTTAVLAGLTLVGGVVVWWLARRGAGWAAAGATRDTRAGSMTAPGAPRPLSGGGPG